MSSISIYHNLICGATITVKTLCVKNMENALGTGYLLFTIFVKKDVDNYQEV